MTSDPNRTQVTQLLNRLREGDEEALNQIFDLVYDELRKIAHKHLRAYRAPAGLDTVALISKLYMKLVDPVQIQSTCREQFYSLASKAMRNILVDWIRHSNRAKRGGDAEHLTLDNLSGIGEGQRPTAFVDLDAALNKLAEIDAESVHIVECKFFAGLTLEEISTAMEIPVSRVRGKWRYAKAWLFDALGG